MEFQRYIFIVLENDICEDKIHFIEYRIKDGSLLKLAHYKFLNGLRLEISAIDDILHEGQYCYSIMEIDKDGNREYYFLQNTLKDVSMIINNTRIKQMI